MVCATLGLIATVVVQPLRAKADDDRQPGRHISMQGIWHQLKLLVRPGSLRQLTVASFVLARIQACMSAFLVIFLGNHINLDFGQRGLYLFPHAPDWRGHAGGLGLTGEPTYPRFHRIGQPGHHLCLLRDPGGAIR